MAGANANIQLNIQSSSAFQTFDWQVVPLKRFSCIYISMSAWIACLRLVKYSILDPFIHIRKYYLCFVILEKGHLQIFGNFSSIGLSEFPRTNTINNSVSESETLIKNLDETEQTNE